MFQSKVKILIIMFYTTLKEPDNVYQHPPL